MNGNYRLITVPEPPHRHPIRDHGVWAPDLLRGSLAMTLDLLTPLHVGGPVPVPARELGFRQGAPGRLVRPFYRQGGQLVVPATSTKGALRALLEMFTYSCPVTDEGQRCRGPKYCLACRVLGALGWQGQWFFSDGLIKRVAPPGKEWRRIEVLPPQYQGKAQGPKRRYYPHQRGDDSEPKTYPVEVLVPGAVVVHMRARFYNLTPEELGAMLIALGQGEPPLCPKLGGGKNAGLGAVRVRVTKYTIWRGEEKQERPLAEYVQQAEASDAVDARALEPLRADLGCARLEEARHD